MKTDKLTVNKVTTQSKQNTWDHGFPENRILLLDFLKKMIFHKFYTQNQFDKIFLIINVFLSIPKQGILKVFCAN